ncbi:pilus assembly protein N-terminal domain-containing protein [Brevundimonas fluminis]|jgi:Flp pilus assembly secretin CpaC|uniref:pilus assembly protein N-terminal domain-containing protein n=1 Tax=Brevundimonas fluminis TaxID=2487274 RepID=UPI000F65791E|nr:pilus assembly protein N-terminal domain-containing protein [Brevundimonas fluminis]
MAFEHRSTRDLLIAAGLLLAAAVPGAAQAQSQALNVEIDQSARIQLRGQAGSVIVGNPQIADVTVVDANTLFVTGKGYGVTEVVVVDGLGRTLFQSQVIVAGGDVGRVRVWRGAQVTEMACAASCAPTLRSPNDGASAAAAPAAAPN